MSNKTFSTGTILKSLKIFSGFYCYLNLNSFVLFSAEPARWLQVLRSGHVCLLTKVFFLNVLLATGDILTDIIVSSEFFGRGDFYWGFCTTLVIMAPILAKKLIQISKIIRSLSNKNWTLAKMQLKSFIHVIGQQHPIG